MVKKLVATAVLAGFAFAASSAQAVTITAVSATGVAPFPLGNFGTGNGMGLQSTSSIQIANGGTISFTSNNDTPQAGVYSGSQASAARTPYADPNSNVNYLVAEPNDPVRINFGATQTSFSLLWGSIDSYNRLVIDFVGNNGTSSVTINGTDVANAGGFSANGSASAYVTISDVGSFNRVVARSTTAAFEFNPSVQVPEPASLALLGAGLAGIGLIRRKKATTAV